MGFRERLNCSLGSGWHIKSVFLCLLLFMLTLIVFSNIGWLPTRLISFHIPIPETFPLMIRKLRPGDSGTDLGDSNCSCATTTQPEAKSTKEHPKPPYIYDYIINEPDKCKDSAPFLVLLIMGERWQKEARQAIRQTWGKEDFLPNVKLLRLFLLGKDTKWTEAEEKPLLEESQAYHDILQQDYLDTYNNLTTKAIMGLNWVATHCPGASYVMKTDTDMFINTEYLVNSLLKPDQPPRLNYFTGALFVDARPHRYKESKWYVSPEEYPGDKYPLFCSGTGYVFSAGLASKIVEVSPAIRWIHLEDVFVGLCLEKLGVQPTAPPKGSDFNIWRTSYTDCSYNQMVTSHGFSPGEIISYWNRLQQNKHKCV